jgi:catechol 2,3-dioxygenase-like lactoylglutathione lyase family enzyme
MTDDKAVVIKDVSHVSIAVSDMDRSIAFYRDVFGWEQIFDECMEGEAFETLTGVAGAAGQACGGRIGSLRVELMHFNFIPPVAASSGLGLRVLSMEVADARAAHGELVARGIPVSGPPVEVFGVRMFFVLDPDGQGIEMCEYVAGGPAWGGAYR